jgi:hypothetical protein
MAVYSTNKLLDLCRNGVALKNEKTDTAAREVCSYIVFAYLLEHETNLPTELESRLDILIDAEKNPAGYPKDILEEAEIEVTEPFDDGPLLA